MKLDPARRRHHRTEGGGHTIGVPGSPGPVPAHWEIIPVEDDPNHFQYVELVQPHGETTCIHSQSDHSICLPHTSLNMSLANNGSSAAGTPVELELRSSAENQAWKFQPNWLRKQTSSEKCIPADKNDDARLFSDPNLRPDESRAAKSPECYPQ